MTNKQTQAKWDEVYASGQQIWTNPNLPRFLDEAVDCADIKAFSPVGVLDIGCGLGYNMEGIARKLRPRRYGDAIVVGMDISWKAIEQASGRISGEFRSQDDPSRFIDFRDPVSFIFQQADFLEYELPSPKDFVVDWTFFHHVDPKRHDNYKEKLRRWLSPGGRHYCMACMGEDEPWFGGEDKVVGDSGLPLYKNRRADVVKLFDPELRLVRFETGRFKDQFPQGSFQDPDNRIGDFYLFRRVK